MKNAHASLNYLFVVNNMPLANLGLVLVMVIVVAVLAATGQFKGFRQYFEQSQQEDNRDRACHSETN